MAVAPTAGSLRSFSRAIGIRLRAALDPNRDVSYFTTCDGQILAVPGYTHTRIYRWGTTDPELYRLIRSLPEHACVVDVGANIGEYTVAAAVSASSGAVHSVEPCPLARPFLELNVRLNRLDNVVVHEVALSEDDSPRSLRFVGRTSNAFLAGGPAQSAEAHEVEFAVRCIRGDALLKQRRIAEVALLKIDVEGAELPVLRGFGGALAQDVAAIVVFELEGRGLTFGYTDRDLVRYLEALGYAVYEFRIEADARKVHLSQINGDRSPRDQAANPNVLAMSSQRQAALRAGAECSLEPENLWG